MSRQIIDHTRHIDIFNARDTFATLIGAGGIGSFTAIVLAKMGIASLSIFDDDEVDPVNIATQLLGVDSLGKEKVAVVKEYIDMFSGLEANAHKLRITHETEPDKINNYIIISGVDSIASRQEIWSVVKNTTADWYIDARMAAEEVWIMTINMADHEWYENEIMSRNDDEIEDLPCTEKATIYTGALAAAYIGSTVRQIITEQTPVRVLVHNMPLNRLVTISD